MNTKLITNALLGAMGLFMLSGCMMSYWEDTSSKNTIQAYESFLKEYPDEDISIEARSRLESLYFNKADHSYSIESYEEYLTRYPSGNYSDKAREKLETLFYQQAKEKNTINAYEYFIGRYPSSKYGEDALSLLETLYFKEAIKENNVNIYEKFLDRFPQSKYAGEVRTILETFYYQEAISKNDVNIYEKFLDRFPQSKYAGEVRTILETLYIQSETILFVNALNRLFERYQAGLSPNEVIAAIDSLLGQYHKADRKLRNLAVKYFEPLSEMERLSKELSSGKFEKYATLIGTALLGGSPGKLLASISSIFGGKKAKKEEEQRVICKMNHISGTFKNLQMEAGQLAQYLKEKYGADLEFENWDFTRGDETQQETAQVNNPNINNLNAHEWSIKGYKLVTIGNYNDAVEALSKAIELNPKDASAYSNRGFAYLKQGKKEIGCLDAHKGCDLGACNTIKWAKSEALCR